MGPADIEIATQCGLLSKDPLGWIMFAFNWGVDPDLSVVKLQEPWRSRYNCEYGPDAWFCQLMDDWGRHMHEQGFDGTHAVQPFLSATASGHGIGKSFGSSLIILFIASTRPHSKGVVTANTSDQLKTKTWGELGKWKKRCITGHWFEYNNGKGNMTLYHKDYPESWRVDAQTCREENSESFAGLHAASSSPWYLFDEASAVPDKIWEVGEGGMTDGEPFWFVFGNPTRNTGRFRECFRKFRHRWRCAQVDSRSVQITNKWKIEEWAKDYGDDSDFFKVRVKGQFPSQALTQFIPEDIVRQAMGRHLRDDQYSFAPKIISVDPAWEGDDALIIAMRQGLAFKILRSIPKNDNDVQIANLVAQLEDEHRADAVFIDGGYGTGIVSVGRTLGRQWQLVWFSEKAINPGYVNKRAEMWGLVKDWLRSGGAMPHDEELAQDLMGPETVPRLDGKIQLESKKDMKNRGLPSPNKADALAITFAYPVYAKKLDRPGTVTHQQTRGEYNPY